MVKLNWIELRELVVDKVQRKELCLVHCQIDMESTSHQIQLIHRCEFGK